MTRHLSIWPSRLRNSRLSVLARWLPEALAIGVLIGIGVFGWLASFQAQLEPLQLTFQLDASRYLNRVEQELVSITDALEQKIAYSQQQGEDSGTIDQDALNRHMVHNNVQTYLGRAELATPTFVDENGPFGGQPDLGANLIPGSQQLVTSTTAHAPIERGSESRARAGKADLFASPAVHSRVLSARDSGNSVLYFAADPVNPGSAIRTWLFSPIYEIDTPWSVRDRRTQFAGVVFSPLDLMGLLSRVTKDFPELSVAVRVGNALLIDDAAHLESGTMRLQPVREIASRSILGQTLDFDIRPTAISASSADGTASTLWILQTILATALLLSIIAYREWISRAAERKQFKRSSEQASRIVALERDNANLESFAYVVSHDLKTPLRKMQALTEVLADDLDCPEGQVVESEDVDECLSRMRDQVSCMDELITGILEYSSTNSSVERVETIDTRATIESVAESIGISTDRLQLHGDFPKIPTWPVKYEQTLANLIGNAFKYHDRPDEARVEISVSGFGDFYLFSVRDDGPGIDPTEHQRIFEIFESIRTPGVDSSGVGLSIVRKAVESVGGTISVDSSLGAGAVFRFTWPKDIGNTKLDSEATT